jgi:hypothetical protein
MQFEIFEAVTLGQEVLVFFTDPINVAFETGCVQHCKVGM